MTRRSVFQRDRKIQIPRACGTYILILRLERTRIIQVGKLGRFRFPLGWFAYVGSAFGPGGLRGRLKHHLNPSSRTHWHIDYLGNVADLNQVWIAKGEKLREHTWAALLEGGSSCAGVRFIRLSLHCPPFSIREAPFVGVLS